MKPFLALLQRIENGVIAVTFIVMTLAVFAQVVNRNLIGAGISWFEELARYCMIYMTLLGTEVGLRDGTQIAVSMVVDKFKGAPRALLTIFSKLVVFAFSSVVFYTSLSLLAKQIKFGQVSPALKLPMYVPYFALPASFAIIALVQGAAIVCIALALARGTYTDDSGNTPGDTPGDTPGEKEAAR
ncbi:MAG: hypothetical protein DELT_01759 [Desulfovibrio sp.]